MVHTAYTMGLRPQETSRLTLDDIQFTKAEMNVGYRKADLPARVPIQQKALKAITACLGGVHSENDCRKLFFAVLSSLQACQFTYCLLCHKNV